jgi:hypothetical protein
VFTTFNILLRPQDQVGWQYSFYHLCQQLFLICCVCISSLLAATIFLPLLAWTERPLFWFSRSGLWHTTRVRNVELLVWQSSNRVGIQRCVRSTNTYRSFCLTDENSSLLPLDQLKKMTSAAGKNAWKWSGSFAPCWLLVKRYFSSVEILTGRSQWPRGLRHKLSSLVGSNTTQGMNVCVCVYSVFRQRPCDGLIPRPRSPTDCV